MKNWNNILLLLIPLLFFPDNLGKKTSKMNEINALMKSNEMKRIEINIINYKSLIKTNLREINYKLYLKENGYHISTKN